MAMINGYTTPAGGCGGGATPAMPGIPALPRPLGPAIGAGFAIPAGFDGAPEAPNPFNGERFVSTAMGGFIVGKDGELAGRVPAGAFVDTTTGKLYGPDNKPIAVPEGAKVDFSDLPDLDVIMEMVKAAAGGGEGELHGERFISSEAGGVIVGTDGEIAGRIPAGSFVDAKSGKVYGPDSKAIAIPEGAKVDFFDLPDLDELLTQVRGGGAKDADAPVKYATAVDGQWGPGGVTNFKGGQVGGEHGGCDMDHAGPGAAKAGGPPSTMPAAMRRQLDQGLAELQRMGLDVNGPFSGRAFPGSHAFHPVWGGGPSTAVGGASGLGTLPSLDASLRELVITLRELTDALAKTTAGGKVDQKTEQKTEAPKTESTPSSTESSSSSTSTTTTTSGSGSGSSSATDDSSSSDESSSDSSSSSSTST